MASLEELREKKRQLESQQKHLEAQQKQLDKEIEQAKVIELKRAQNAVSKKIEDMTDKEKKFILDHIDHNAPDCSDYNPCNGFNYSIGGPSWRCKKCMLMEIFNGEHDGMFDFELTVDINEVTV